MSRRARAVRRVRRVRAAVLPAVLLPLCWTPARSANGQTPTQACYVPGSGTVYRVGVANSTPPACIDPAHVSFSLLGLPIADTRSSTSPLLSLINTNGVGGTVYGESKGSNATAIFNNLGSGIALAVNSNGPIPSVGINNLATTGITSAIHAFSNADGATAVFENRGTADAMQVYSNGAISTMFVRNKSTGHAAAFRSNSTDATAVFVHDGGGNALRTQGSMFVDGTLRVTGSLFVNGTKSSVLSTSGGERAVYAEEAAEVWITDYGFARLAAGRAHVTLDSTFAGAMSPTAPYHVFVQPYDTVHVAVVRRDAAGFELRAVGGADSVDVSYRIVAKRRGYEQVRLERQPR